MRLFHYTCGHSLQAILNDGGVLRPNPHQGFQPQATAVARQYGIAVDVIVLPVVWLTDIDVAGPADADAIGLGGSEVVTCNRVAYRFRVGNVGVHHWPTWADDNVTDPAWRSLLELGRQPERWWVATGPVNGRFDETYRPY